MAHVLPDILLRIELRALRRDRDDRDIVGDLELGRQEPAGLVHGHDGVRAGGNCAGDLCQMQGLVLVLQKGRTRPAALPS